MVQFHPVELTKGFKAAKALADAYTWEEKLGELVKGETSKAVVEVRHFDDVSFGELIHNLKSDIALEIEHQSLPSDRTLDPKVKATWVATARKVCGYRVLMRWIGCEEDESEHDFWVNFCSADIHRIGWTSENRPNGAFYIPPQFLFDRRTDWPSFFVEKLSPLRTVVRQFETFKRQVTKCKLQVGERVELLDNQVSTRVRPATVVKTVGRRVCLTVKSTDCDGKHDPHAEDIGEERQYESDFWCDQSSYFIFHVGWAHLNDYTLYARDAYTKHAAEVAGALSKGVEPDWSGSDVRPETVMEWTESSDPKAFDVGMKLELLDPLDTTFNQLKVATVINILKRGYIVVGADGDDQEREAIPFHCTSNFLFPVGYAKKYGIKLVPPSNSDAKKFDWNSYLKQTQASAAPEFLFPHVPLAAEMAEKFPIGASLEASDLNESQLICPAHIVAIKGRLLEIGYDGWDSTYNQLFDYRSHDIFPLGWSEAHGYKLELPHGYQEPSKKKRKH
ncbi:unnamed protein product, partial [Mesorhabditis spiculigera]